VVGNKLDVVWACEAIAALRERVVGVRAGWKIEPFRPACIRGITNAMNASTRDTTKRERRPRADAPGTPIVVRMQPDQLAPLDALIADQPEPKPSRPDVLREALRLHLKAQGYVE
jgi:hypothetical protein